MEEIWMGIAHFDQFWWKIVKLVILGGFGSGMRCLEMEGPILEVFTGVLINFGHFDQNGHFGHFAQNGHFGHFGHF